MDTLNLLTYEEIANQTGIPVPTLRVMAQRGQLPEPSVRVGQSPAWSGPDILKWIANNKRA